MLKVKSVRENEKWEIEKKVDKGDGRESEMVDRCRKEIEKMNNC